MRYDVFNGDADGLCALHMLRMVFPAQRTLITGVKREVDLLRRVPHAPAPDLLVLDIAVDANVTELQRLLDGGADVTWFDHHTFDQAPQHPQLRLYCDSAADVCTSILVDRYLAGRHRPWAVAAAFGDNLEAPARLLAEGLGWPAREVAALASLGQTLNYNAYGETEADLHMPPAQLYRKLCDYEDPRDFLACGLYADLHDGYRADCARLHGVRPYWQRGAHAVYLLPSAPWARRVSGVLANRLAAQQQDAAFAVLLERSDGDFVVSVRSGQPDSHSACVLCAQFPGGGGRKAAAGINRLPADQLSEFMRRFQAYFAAPSTHSHAA